MDDINQLRHGLDTLREQSARLHPTAPSPQTHLELVALGSWDRADELVEGLQRLAAPPARTRCCSILARTLWEDSITLAYIAKNPASRIEQARASLVRDYDDLARAPWSRNLNFDPMPDDAMEWLRQRRQIEKNARKAANKSSVSVPADSYACLPSVYERAKAVNGEEMYAVYQVESRDGVHFGLAAIANVPGMDPGRLLLTLSLAIESYRVLLRTVAGCLGIENSIP